jgi:hypothetical protein
MAKSANVRNSANLPVVYISMHSIVRNHSNSLSSSDSNGIVLEKWLFQLEFQLFRENASIPVYQHELGLPLVYDIFNSIIYQNYVI